jgi:hypothetical protein
VSRDGTRTYALAICFSTLLCGAITAGFLMFNAVKYAFPLLTIDPGQTQFLESNETFRSSRAHPSMMMHRAISLSPNGEMTSPRFVPEENDRLAGLSEQEVEQLRLAQLDSVYGRHRHYALQGIILQVIILLICTGLFFVHWKLGRRLSPDTAP